MPIDYRATSGNATTVIGIAKAHPAELTTVSRLLFYQGGYSDSLGHFLKMLIKRTISGFYTNLDLLLSITDRKSDIVLVDPRGVYWFFTPFIHRLVGSLH